MTHALLAGVDDRVNFGFATVTEAPSPAVSGLAMTVAAGPRPLAPYWGTVYSSSAPRPLAANAEVFRVEADAGGKLTIARGQQGTAPIGIAVGDVVLFGETRETLTQIEAAVLELVEDERERAERIEQTRMKIGTAVSYEQVVENLLATPKYLKTVKSRLGDVWVAETESKMEVTFNGGTKAKPVAPDVSKFAAMAAILGSKPDIVLHTMIWHSGLPKWLTEPTVAWTPATLLEAMKVYIRLTVPALIAACPRGEEQVIRIDGLNEIAAEAGVSLRTSFWTEQFGGSTAVVKTNEAMVFFSEMLKTIKEVAPNVTIAYNEFACERESQYRTPTEVTEGKPLKKGDVMLLIVKVLQELGAPIEAVGFQCHLQTTFFPRADELTTNFEKVAALNVQPLVTELDLKIIEEEGKGTLGKHAEAVGEIVHACENVGMPALLVWGATDAKSWLGVSTLTSGPRGTMFDTELNPKPAYTILAAARAGSGPAPRLLIDRLSGETARASNTPFTPSQEEASKTGRDCEVSLSVTLAAEETEYEILIGARRKLLFKRKTPVAADVEPHTFSVPASTAWELKTIKGAVTIKSTYAFLSR